MDNSRKLIKKLMKKDKRIIYINNKDNKGSFYSRNVGVLFSKGEYILINDPDDFLLNYILFKAYKISKLFCNIMLSKVLIKIMISGAKININLGFCMKMKSKMYFFIV